MRSGAGIAEQCSSRAGTVRIMNVSKGGRLGPCKYGTAVAVSGGASSGRKGRGSVQELCGLVTIHLRQLTCVYSFIAVG